MTFESLLRGALPTHTLHTPKKETTEFQGVLEPSPSWGGAGHVLAKPPTTFERLLDVIEVSCQEQCISEGDYHAIVACIRHHSGHERDLSDAEKMSIIRRPKWNPSYNPFIDPAKIRVSFAFGACNNMQVRAALSAYYLSESDTVDTLTD